jgi:collagenase-like protein with putative collagen-binding domain
MVRPQREHEEHFLRFFDSRTDALLMSNADHIYDGYNPHQISEVDIVSRHGGWTGQHSAFVAGFNKTPAKSYFQSEAVPEYNGTNMSIATIRRSAWEQTMAGAGWVAQNDTSFGWDPNTDIASQSANRDLAYDNIGHVATFFNDMGIKFWNMAPDPSLANTGICLADTGDEYLVYAATGGAFSVNLSAALGEPVRVLWYNPRTGDLTTTAPITGSASASFTAPDSNDWVLRLTVTPELAGDANGDGSVNVTDLGILATNYGAGSGFG